MPTIPRMNFSRSTFTVIAVLAVAAAGCGSSGSSSGSSGGSSPAAEAKATASGDIPDNQVFLRYRNATAGYSVKYPEGWARKGSPNAISFSDKDNQVRVAIAKGGAPSASQAKAALAKAGLPGLKINSVQTTKIGGSPAIHLFYHQRGPTDPVTGKRLTLQVDRYVTGAKGKVATIDESTPVGVDNVDAYRLIAHSFQWQ